MDGGRSDIYAPAKRSNRAAEMPRGCSLRDAARTTAHIMSKRIDVVTEFMHLREIGFDVFRIPLHRPLHRGLCRNPVRSHGQKAFAIAGEVLAVEMNRWQLSWWSQPKLLKSADRGRGLSATAVAHNRRRFQFPPTFLRTRSVSSSSPLFRLASYDDPYWRTSISSINVHTSTRSRLHLNLHITPIHARQIRQGVPERKRAIAGCRLLHRADGSKVHVVV